MPHKLRYIGIAREILPVGAVAQSVERATPGEEVLGSIPLWPLTPYWLGRCQYNVTETEAMVSLLCLVCGST